MQILKVPQWLAARKDDDDMEDNYTVPPVAMLPQPSKEPMPEFSAEDEDKMVFGRAAVMLEQLKRDRADALQREQNLQAELAESVLARAGDQKKIELLELDNAQQANDIQTLQSQIEEYRRFMNVWKDMNDKTRSVFDRFGVKGTPKKERKPRAKKEKAKRHDRQETDQPAEAAG